MLTLFAAWTLNPLGLCQSGHPAVTLILTWHPLLGMLVNCVRRGHIRGNIVHYGERCVLKHNIPSNIVSLDRMFGRHSVRGDISLSDAVLGLVYKLSCQFQSLSLVHFPDNLAIWTALECPSFAPQNGVKREPVPTCVDMYMQLYGYYVIINFLVFFPYPL